MPFWKRKPKDTVVKAQRDVLLELLAIEENPRKAILRMSRPDGRAEEFDFCVGDTLTVRYNFNVTHNFDGFNETPYK